MTVFSLLLLAHSILTAHFEIGFLGLINGLPPSYFASLVLLALASAILWTDHDNHSRLLGLQLVILAAALWLVPVITGGSHPWTDEKYEKFALVDYISAEGSFSVRSIYYLSWPGVHVLLTMLNKIFPVDYMSIVTPLMSATPLILLPSLYLFLKKLLPQSLNANYLWAGLMLLTVADWGGTDATTPHGTGFLLIFMLLALIFSMLQNKNYNKHSVYFLIMLMAVVVALTHLLASLILFAMLIVIFLVKRSKAGFVILLCLLSFIVVWDYADGGHYLNYAINKLPTEPAVVETPVIDEPVSPDEQPEPDDNEVTEPAASAEESLSGDILLLDPAKLAHREVTGHFSGNEAHAVVAKIRAGISLVFALLGFFGAGYVFLFNKDRLTPILVVLLTLAPLVLLPLSIYYSKELIRRLYQFALPGMAYFTARLLETRRSQLVVMLFGLVVIVGIPLHLISHYGNQEMDYFPAERLAALEFFEANTVHGKVTGAYPTGRYGELYKYQFSYYEQLKWQDNRLLSEDNASLPHYIGLSNEDRTWYGWLLEENEFIKDMESQLESATNCNRIYYNADYELFLRDIEIKAN